MARKSSSGTIFMVALYAVGGYFVYENWATISAWIDTVIPQPTAGAATASGFYPNSPVPTSYSTMQTFVDSAGNQWQFSTQTGTWVIASPGPAPASPSPGTVVSTVPQPLPALAPAPVAAVPASPGTLVAVAPAPVAAAAPAMPAVTARVGPVTGTVQANPVAASAPIARTVNPIYGMPHYRGW